MGLDISAYSHLRYAKPAPEDGEYDYDVFVHVYKIEGDRVDGAPYGLYMRTEDVDVWWKAEHGTFDVPASERERLEAHIAGLHDGSTKPGTPGDLAVLDEDRAITESTGFRAGSYSGYNWWRKQLSLCAIDTDPEIVWEGDMDGEPFTELINFPDNEGAIGSKTAAKLLHDFTEFETKVLEEARKRITEKGELEYFIEIYGEFKTAFELAAANGFVIFH